ncbi:MAG: porin [Acidobacteriota bacterium]
MKRILIIVSIIFLMVFSISADVKFKGLMQNWFSIADDSIDETNSFYGFSNKRIRFAPYGKLGEKITWGVQFAFDKFSTPTVLDVFMNYAISGQFNLKVGKFAPPGSIGAALTSSGKLDAIERAPIVMAWGANSGLHGYRAFGAQLSGKMMEGKLYYALMLANSQTSEHNWLPSVKTVTTTANTHNGTGLWGRLEASPMRGLRFGGFFGKSTEEDNNSVKLERSSYGAHLFYVKNKFNLKVEYISGETGNIKYNGMYLVAGYRINKIEPVLSYSFYVPFEDGEKLSNITAGINIFYKKNIKFQVNYVLKDEENSDIKNNIFYANFQYSFNSK